MKIFFMAFLWLFSCAQKPVAPKPVEAKVENLGEHKLQIRFLNNLKEFDNNEPVTISSIIIEKHEIYISNFTRIEKETYNNFLDKRKTAFLKLFANDTDPYTGKEIERKHCLKKINADSVEFLSGPRTSWADCRITKSGNIKNPAAIRRWILCHNTVWEITVRSERYNQAEFICH